jgi:hypothetical protein
MIPVSGRNLTALFSLVVALTGVLGVGVASAVAASGEGPAWSVQSVAEPTSFSPKDTARCTTQPEPERCDYYSLTVTNVGSRPSEGQVTVVDTLPEGVTAASTPLASSESGEAFSCTVNPVAAHSVITCTSESVIPAATPALAAIRIPVFVAPGTGVGTVAVNHVEVSGGNATRVTVSDNATPIEEGPQPFGVLSGSFTLALFDVNGAIETQAGGHPGSLYTTFALPSAMTILPSSEFGADSVEEFKQIVTDLPPGVIGDALAAPSCPLSTVSTISRGNPNACPPATQVGTLSLIEPEPYGSPSTELKIFNVTPEYGYPAEFAVYFPTVGRAVLLYASLVGDGATAHVRVISTPQDSVVGFDAISLTFFGTPAVRDGNTQTPVAFFTDPSYCGAEGFTSTIHVDSWQHPGRFESDGEPDLSDPNWKSASSTSPPVGGCESLRFHPTLTFAPEPEHARADEPSGYSSTLQIPQNEDPNGLATPPLKNTVVTLPAGVAISPAAADGLVGCELGSAGIGLESEMEASRPGHCPEASKVGKVEAVTPVLKEPLTGGVYVAQPGCSPCSEAQAENGEVFALYLELGNEVSGVHVKLEGKVEVGGNGQHSREVGLALGQVRTTFAKTPQDPVSELKLEFNGEQRAPLANPQSCGSFTTGAELEPWSHIPAPGEKEGTPNATLNPSFAVSGCENKFSPVFTAGTTNPQAGGYSPFTLTFSRQDREQDLSGVTVSMPPGLLGKVAGVSQCGEAQASAGTCPAASQVGTATGGAGSGSQPFYQSGPVYLTGPYKGAPFGLAIVVPAVAGPFNLGNIVVRAAIFVNPTTAAISVVSDPLPQSVDGVPLRLKTVNVTVGANGSFTFNPTNCSEQKIGATLTGTGGASVPVSSRFQAANCASLPFKPVLAAATQGKTSKANGASLAVTLRSGAGQANIGKVSLELPKQLPARLTTIQKACTEAQFNLNPAGCPEASVIGTAKAVTPLLNVPLVGPAYFVSHGGAAFPDVEFILQGEDVVIVLDGKTQIKKGVTYSHFETVPDAPISTFETTFPEGKYSVLATDIPPSAKSSLCGLALSLPTTITGQNGAVLSQATKAAVTGCAKKAKTKTLTRAQKLAKALEECKQDRKKAKRAGCERSARKEYGPLTKKKTSKKKTTSGKK